MANQNSKKKNTKKTNSKANTNVKKVVAKKEEKKEEKVLTKEVKKVEPKKEVKKEVEEIKVPKFEKKETKKDIKKETKEKKCFSLTAKQKDLILVLLVVVLLVVACLITGSKKEPKSDIELPVALAGEAGFNEITYSEYEEKIDSKEPFLVVIVKDGCGYCEMYEPILEEVANEYKLPINYINLAHLSEEEYNNLSSSNSYLKKNQWGTPTTLFMVGDEVENSIGGYVEKDELVSFVEKNFVVEKNAE